MNKNERAAKHIEDELHNAARNIAYEVNILLYACERATLDKVLEIIDTAQTYKMFPGEKDTYIDKGVIREAVEVLKEGYDERNMG